MGERTYTTFAEFWPFYVGEHRSPLNRALHYLGTSTALGVLLYSALSGRPLFGLDSHPMPAACMSPALIWGTGSKRAT